jgi:hypothetical protein
MKRRTVPVQVYLESGAKRTFAAALDWPGWCRPGRNETDALAALLAYGPRYASILAGARWSARYFVRRVTWHVIAHAWEIDRRVT